MRPVGCPPEVKVFAGYTHGSDEGNMHASVIMEERRIEERLYLEIFNLTPLNLCTLVGAVLITFEWDEKG